jgi:hypothetical protein
MLAPDRDGLPLQALVRPACDPNLLSQNQALLDNKDLLEDRENQGVPFIPGLDGTVYNTVERDSFDVETAAKQRLFDIDVACLDGLVDPETTNLVLSFFYLDPLLDHRDHTSFAQLLRFPVYGVLGLPGAYGGPASVPIQFFDRHAQPVSTIRPRLQR